MDADARRRAEEVRERHRNLWDEINGVCRLGSECGECILLSAFDAVAQAVKECQDNALGIIMAPCLKCAQQAEEIARLKDRLKRLDGAADMRAETENHDLREEIARLRSRIYVLTGEMPDER